MTIFIPDQAPRTNSAIQPRATIRSTRRFRTILAIHRGEVYIRSTELPESGWLVRANAAVASAPARTLRTAA